MIPKSVAAGVLFGIGFLCGFASGYKYAAENIVCEVPPLFSGTKDIPSEDISAYSAAVSETEISGDIPDAGETADIGLSLQEHWMDSDDQGLYIAGMVKNDSANSFDAVRIAFDLCDSEGQVYTAVTARNDERIEAGESWDFTAYIPYSDMDKFSSYRLQSIMGVKK
jgi:hypothetical protein